MAEDIYAEAVALWGVEAQLSKAVEEAAELISAIQHWRSDRIHDHDFASEIADMEIMCKQLRLIVGEHHVEVCRGYKQRRLRTLIDDAAARRASMPDWVAPR